MGEVERYKQAVYIVGTMIRDQANKYLRTRLQSDDEELFRLISVLNKPPEIAEALALEFLPKDYISPSVEAKNWYGPG